MLGLFDGLPIPSDWITIEDSPTCLTLGRLDYGDDGQPCVRIQKQIKNAEEFMSANSQWRAEVANQKWGDGQVIGRMPDSMYFTSGMAEARKNNDEKWIKRFWSDPDHKKLRIKEGNL